MENKFKKWADDYNYTILSIKESVDKVKVVVATGLYQIPGGGITAELVGETRHFFRKNKKGGYHRYYKKIKYNY